MRRGRPYLLSWLILGGLTVGAVSRAGPDNTIRDELRVFKEEIAAQCKDVKARLEDFRLRSDPLTGYNLKDAVQSLCVCMPTRAETLTRTLTAEELARASTDENFLRLMQPAVLEPCAAEQLQSMYGEECPRRFRRSGVDVAHYCACMKEVVGGYSAARAAGIATLASAWLPQAAEAEKKGEPAPPRPPELEDYYQADQRCKVGEP